MNIQWIYAIYIDIMHILLQTVNVWCKIFILKLKSSPASLIGSCWWIGITCVVVVVCYVCVVCLMYIMDVYVCDIVSLMTRSPDQRKLTEIFLRIPVHNTIDVHLQSKNATLNGLKIMQQTPLISHWLQWSNNSYRNKSKTRRNHTILFRRCITLYVFR